MNTAEELRAALTKMDCAIDDMQDNLTLWIQETIDNLEGDEPDIATCVSELKDILFEIKWNR